MSLCTEIRGETMKGRRGIVQPAFLSLIQLKSVLFLIYGNHWFYMLSCLNKILQVLLSVLADVINAALYRA